MKSILLVAAMFTASLATGCGSACSTLSDLCDKCKDSGTKSACETTASTYKVLYNGNSACQSVLDSGAYNSCN